MKNKHIRIKAICFHLVGTLVQTDEQNFDDIKQSIGCPPDDSVIAFIRKSIKTEQKKLLAELENRELQAAAGATATPGAETLLTNLRSKNLHWGLLSDSSRSTVEQLRQQVPALRQIQFDVVICRDDLLKQKADLNFVQLAAEKLNLAPEHILVVGVNDTDLRPAQHAGALTAFFNHPSGGRQSPGESDFQISQLDELSAIIRMGIPLPAGKLPNDLLREFLDQFVFNDPSILINPGIGEDTAAVDMQAEEVLVLKSDPITFASDSIGQYAVLINANDIATSGARPRWLLTTLLFPPGVTPSEIRHVVYELKDFCQQWQITLCGGHTEITDAVSRPVVVGMMAGTVAKDDLIDKRNMITGDRILLTKGVAVEGTAIIAREFADKLINLGMSTPEIEKCAAFLADLSIIPEAQIAASHKGTSAMHDVTEGGLATALEELGIAGGHKIRVEMEAVPVFRQTSKISRLLDINPLGLIGSGSLLICSHTDSWETLSQAIQDAGIKVACIGEVLDEGQGIEAYKDGNRVTWPRFEVDEIARLFGQGEGPATSW